MTEPLFPPTQEELSSLAELFMNLSHGESVNEASAMIQHLVHTELTKLVICSAHLLSVDDIAIPIAFQALCTMRKAFTPHGSVTLEMVSELWLVVDPSLRRLVHESVFRGLMFNNRSVIGMASLVFALLVACETDMMLELVPQLFLLVTDEIYSFDTKIGAIDTLREICDPAILGRQVSVPAVRDCLSCVYDQLDVWLGSFTQVPATMQISIIRALNAFVAISGWFFQQRGKSKQFLGRVMPLLDIQIARDTFKEIMILLATFVKQRYSADDFQFDRIGNMTVAIIHEDSGDYAAMAMDFWIAIGRMEWRIQKRYNTFMRVKTLLAEERMIAKRVGPKIPSGPIRPKGLCVHAAEQLGQRILDFLLLIDPNRPQEEDTTKGLLPHMFATVLLQTFFKHAPDTVFRVVREFWHRSLLGYDVRELPWPHQHALILSLSCILKKPDHPDVHSFLTETLPTEDQLPLLIYITMGISAPYPIIQDTSLYIIYMCIKRYQLMMNHEAIVPILTSMAELLQSNPSDILVSRIFMVLKVMIAAGKGLGQAFFEEFFDPIYSFPIFALERPEAQASPIFRQAHHIITFLIENSPDCMEARVITILEEALQALTETLNADFQEAVVQVQQEKLGIVTVCFHRFGNAFCAFGVRTADLLFDLMRNKNRAIWEDALIALIMIITHLTDQSADLYTTERITSLITNALESESPEVITNVVLALSQFYKALVSSDSRAQAQPRAELLDRLPNSFDLIITCLGDTRFARGFYPNLLEALSQIISASAGCVTPTDRERLFQVYWQAFSDLTFDTENQEDVAHANNVFAAVFKGFTAILETYGPTDPIIDNHTLMRSYIIRPPQKFLDVGSFTKASMTAFCAFLRKYNDVYRRKGNILLNRRPNWMLLLHGKTINDKRLKETVEETIKVVQEA
jgi:hypothetical protein